MQNPIPKKVSIPIKASTSSPIGNKTVPVPIPVPMHNHQVIQNVMSKVHPMNSKDKGSEC